MFIFYFLSFLRNSFFFFLIPFFHRLFMVSKKPQLVTFPIVSHTHIYIFSLKIHDVEHEQENNETLYLVESL